MLLLAWFGGCESREKIPLRVFVAGSLFLPFAELEKAYEAAHPNVDILLEAHGSIQVIRNVTEIHERVDVVVSADHALIPMMMYATGDPDTGKPYAMWHIKFASNELVLAYTSRSRYADEINRDNWHEIIARPDVKVGIADPRLDPCGYRSLMTLKLTESVREGSTVFAEVILGQFKNGITAEDEGGVSIIRIQENLDIKPDARLIIRNSSIQLIALLESGDIDYAFEYESATLQRNLLLLRLPDAVNLGVPEYAAEYAKVQVRMDFQRFLSVNPVFNGESSATG
jgi:molybdate/tungstate transport system substrate-binding protein